MTTAAAARSVVSLEADGGRSWWTAEGAAIGAALADHLDPTAAQVVEGQPAAAGGDERAGGGEHGVSHGVLGDRQPAGRLEVFHSPRNARNPGSIR